MQHFWRVLRIGAIATITGLVVHSQGTELTPDQMVAINGVITGAVEAVYRYFVPHGSVTTLSQIEAIITAAVDEAVRQQASQPASNTTVIAPVVHVPVAETPQSETGA